MKAGDKIYWVSLDGKRKGEYTVREITPVTNQRGSKAYVEERKKPIAFEYVNEDIDEFTRYYIWEGKYWFNSKLLRKAFEMRVLPYLEWVK